ncbi:MAG TPA: 16S rRNA (guanine(966)-N(2))-methyltransferase RsmD [Aeromicrobium sp.]|nr:16S rRNA (guanine(966)-N(2))-methyltransferase RsmD [Aeromicrobium sp.]
MTRVISGKWGGRRLQTPAGDKTRPTSDRVREAAFSSLGSLLGGFDGLRVLDLFAGSGALAFEALSRGAAHADLIEADAKVVAVIKRNAEILEASVRVHRTSAEKFVEHATGPWDLVFIDPPYAMATAEVSALVAQLRPSLSEGALVVVERSRRDPFIWPENFEAVRDKAYGETQLWYGR